MPQIPRPIEGWFESAACGPAAPHRQSPGPMSRRTLASCMTPLPFTVGPDDSLRMARTIMRDHGIRHLPVVADERLVGVLSERDATSQSATGRNVVRDAMTPAPFVVQIEAPLAEVAREMARRKLGSTIVLDGERVVGIFTTMDALRVLADDAQA
jgi:acetoin utilization protein AcuB